jgi:hypothetical protein
MPQMSMRVEIFRRDLSNITIQDTLNEGNGRFDLSLCVMIIMFID